MSSQSDQVEALRQIYVAKRHLEIAVNIMAATAGTLDVKLSKASAKLFQRAWHKFEDDVNPAIGDRAIAEFAQVLAEIAEKNTEPEEEAPGVGAVFETGAPPREEE